MLYDIPRLAALAVGILLSGCDGHTRVIDGDTIVVAGEKIRLEGIDAPEMDQVCLTDEGKCWRCGADSRKALQADLAGMSPSCQPNGRDRYRRILGRCESNGEDINAKMVREGWALSFVRYGDRYRAEEEEAKAAKRGLWAGAFIAPWDWRHRSEVTTVYGAEAVPLKGRALLLMEDPAKACPTR